MRQACASFTPHLGSEKILMLGTSLSHWEPAAAMGVIYDADHSLLAISLCNELSSLSFTGIISNFGK